MGTDRNAVRVDGRAKVDGTTRFCADLIVEGMWHGAVVRAPAGPGPILSVERDPAFDWDGVVVVTADDIPGANVIRIIEADMPCLASASVRYPGEPVALVAAPTREMARRAASMMVVRIGPETRERGDDDAVFSQYAIDVGDVGAAFDEGHLVTQGEYRTGPQEHVYLETQAMVCIPESETLRCIGSMQCPYYVRPVVAEVMGVKEQSVVVQQAPTGGGFGGKEDFPSIMAAHAALLAWHAGRPVSLVYDRTEDICFSTKRHASFTRMRSAVTRDGRLVALDASIVLEAGAYVTLTPVVLLRAILHLSGVYRCPNVRLRAKAVRTATVPAGAFRGFGAPQAHFAIESHIDDVASALGIPATHIRRINAFETGDVMATGQVLASSVGARECLDSVIGRCDFDALRAAMDARNASGTTPVKRGLGLACCLHGGGFTGNGERDLASTVGLHRLEDGTIEILTANTEMGQGLLTAFSQIVSERLGMGMDRVRCDLPDTSRVPDSGPTVSSRSTMVVGKILERAADALALKMAEFPDQEVSVEISHEPDPLHRWDERTLKGTAYPVYSFGAVAVEVEVDSETCEVTPVKMWMAYDVGRAINPMAARGQLEGGSLQALGWGLCEQLTVGEHGYRQGRLATYIIPTSADVPAMDLAIIEMPYPGGPCGAKGLGELPMNAVAPALRNAVCHALATRIDSIPLTPESIFAQKESGP